MLLNILTQEDDYLGFYRYVCFVILSCYHHGLLAFEVLIIKVVFKRKSELYWVRGSSLDEVQGAADL